MNIVTKYDIGDVVHPIIYVEDEIEVEDNNDELLTVGEWIVVEPNSISAVLIEKYRNAKGDDYMHNSIKYNAAPLRACHRLYNEDDLFTSMEEAQAECDKRNEEGNTPWWVSTVSVRKQGVL